VNGPLISVVVAISGPEAYPDTVVEGIGKALHAAGYRCEFVFVLDGPATRFERELRELAAKWTIRIVQLEGGGLGESIALSAGVAKAQGDHIVNVPPYLQVEPEEIAKVVAALEAGADCVATWRRSRIDPWLNQVQSKLFNWLLRWIMNTPFHDLNSGTRGFRRNVLEEVAVYGELYRFLPVLARRQGFRVVEVEVRHREEKGRAGFYGVGVYLRRMLDIVAITFLTRFTQRPLRFFGYLGFTAIAIGAPLASWYLYGRIVEDVPLSDKPGFVIGAILAAFGVQLIGFGLVGEIIIFTQSPNLRDYKIEGMVEGGAEPAERPHAEPAERPAEPARELEGERVPPAGDSPLPLRVRELLPGEDSRWDSYVSRHPLGTHFHRSGWSRVVSESFRHQGHHLVVEQGRRWLGVLPLFLTKSPFLGRNMVSLPYAVYGGVLCENEAAQQALLDHAAQLGRQLRVGYVELRHLEARPGERLHSPLYVTFRRQLPERAEDVLPSLPKKARAEVRYSLRAGVRVTADCPMDLLVDLFAENKRRLGSPTLPRRWFHALAEEFGKAVVVHRAVDPSGRTLAAVMSFCFRDTLYAYYSGSLAEANDTGVNNHIYCAIMEWAVERGYTRFDFGRSRADSGPAKFKKNMGFVAEPLHYEYLLVGDGAHLPDFHPSNPRLALPRRVWSHMPMWIANPLGARLSRYLP
jgi:FemAB-related protein (PEP-CTERM system-associated)